MNNKVKKLNEKIEPYYALITMIIFFGGLFVTAYKYVISPSDLKVSIKKESVDYPNSIKKGFEDVYEFALRNDSLKNQSIDLYSFLIKTTDLKTINIVNNGETTVKGIKFKQLNADALTAYSITSDFLTSAEEASLRRNLEFDESHKIIYMNEPADIPAKKSIKIRLWGSFKPTLFNDETIISSDDGDAHIEDSYEVSGVKGYLINYYLELVVLMIIIFVLVYYVGIRQASKK